MALSLQVLGEILVFAGFFAFPEKKLGLNEKVISGL